MKSLKRKYLILNDSKLIKTGLDWPRHIANIKISLQGSNNSKKDISK